MWNSDSAFTELMSESAEAWDTRQQHKQRHQSVVTAVKQQQIRKSGVQHQSPSPEMEILTSRSAAAITGSVAVGTLAAAGRTS